MNANFWIPLGLIVVDLWILVRLYLSLRSQAPPDRRTLFMVGGVYVGFSFFGFSRDSTLCIIHLATMAGAFAIFLFRTCGRKERMHNAA